MKDSEREQIRALMEEGKDAEQIAGMLGLSRHAVGGAIGMMKKKAEAAEGKGSETKPEGSETKQKAREAKPKAPEARPAKAAGEAPEDREIVLEALRILGRITEGLIAVIEREVSGNG